jgi:Flp pilus assembly protein TadB
MIFLVVQDIWFSVKRARKEAKEFGLQAALNTNLKRLMIVFVMISLVSFVRNITFIIPPVWWFVLAVVVFLTASLLSRLLKQR